MLIVELEVFGRRFRARIPPCTETSNSSRGHETCARRAYLTLFLDLILCQANILIDEKGRAALCDFGLATILDDQPTGFTNSLVGGTDRFLAPELLNDDVCRSLQSDVYAFGCVCAQVRFTRYILSSQVSKSHYTFRHWRKILYEKPPYHKLKNSAVQAAIEKKEYPYDLSTETENCTIHHFLYHCWISPAAGRPSMPAAYNELGKRLVEILWYI